MELNRRREYPSFGALIAATIVFLLSTFSFANDLSDDDRSLIKSHGAFCSEEVCLPYSEFTYLRADLDGTGENNYIIGLGETEDDLAVLVLFKSEELGLRKMYEKSSLSLGYMSTVSAFDIDGDSASEVIVTQLQGAGSHYISTWVYSWNNGVFSSIVPSEVDSGDEISSLDNVEFIDLNGDKSLEAISTSAFRNVEEIYRERIISTLYALNDNLFQSVGEIEGDFVFTRSKGAPQKACEHLPLDTTGDYGIFSINNEEIPISNAVISVNGDILFNFNDFNRKLKKKYGRTSLSKHNEICATVYGEPESSLRVIIGKFKSDF